MATNDDMRSSVAKTTGVIEHYEALAREFEVTVEEAGRSDAWSVYWFWLHWGQYRSLREGGDDEELKHLIREFYPTTAV